MKEWLLDLFCETKADLVKAHKSLTIWFNVVVLPALIVYWPQIWEALPYLKSTLPDSKYQVLLFLGGIINTGFRFHTDRAIRDK